MTPEDFIDAISSAAQTVMKTTRVPASVSIAQGALESGWGQHAPGFNLFGIKADASWKGPFTAQATKEYVDGKTVITQARFRAYPDWLGSIEDHARFLVENPRYQPAFEHADDGEGFACELAKCGYATDPNYAQKLTWIINEHELMKYDKEST